MSRQRVIVVGAGAVGIGVALFLQGEGLDVTLVDRAEPGQQTSFGNAGIISVQSVSSINSPDVFRKLPKLAFSPTSPLRIRWRDLPWTMPWLLAFLNNCREAPALRSSLGQVALSKASGEAWRVLLQRHGGNDRVTWPGWLKLAESKAEVASLQHERRRQEEEGLHAEWLDADQVAALEPALAPRFAAGLWLKGNGQVDRPGELLQHLVERFAVEGGRLVADEVRDLRSAASGVEVVTSRRSLRADHAVLATGPWSARLARKLGSRQRLVAERGYHLMLPQAEMPIGRPLYVADTGFVLAPMGDALRLTAGAEIARIDTPGDETRVRGCLAEVRRWLPAAATEVASSWVGARPSTPDGLPVIDRAPRLPRVVLAYGHGHLGLTMGPLTGRLVADLIRERPPALDLTPYSAVR